MSRHKKFAFVFTIFSLLLLSAALQVSTFSALTAENMNHNFSFSLESGFYEDDIQVALSLSSPAQGHLQIRYTLDGSTPDASSALYKTPLVYEAKETMQTVVVKAVVCDPKRRIVGGPYTATYFIGKNIPVLSDAIVVSITADPDDLFSQENGILYPMADCGPTEEDWKAFEKQNCKQRGDDWIRNAHMDVFEWNGSHVVSQNIGLCVDGDHGSMTHYPYSLKALAGEEYDADHPSFQYDFFHYYNIRGTPFPHIQNFNNIVFRNGGNEYNAGVDDPEQRGTMLRWSIGSRLADEAGYLTAGSRPAIVFLNGELYSVATLQDTYNRYNIGARVLADKNDLEIFKDAERACTKNGGYENLYYSYPDIEASPILSAENQAKFEETVSIDDMFSYYAFQALINNTDFPKKNYAIWRYTGEDADTFYGDGKYRCLVNDLDCTWNFRYDDDVWTAYFHHIKEDGTVMGSLIQIDEYKARFVNIVCDLINSGLFDREHLEQVIDEANLDFYLIASYYYSPEDEAKRQQNVTLLKESAFARKDDVQNFIQSTFSPAYPYILSVKTPESGTSIRFSTTQLICTDPDFEGTYYGDYPMTLSADCNDHRSFSYWKINGKRVDTPKVTLDASLIRDGRITAELVTVPAASETSGLLISEVCSDGAGASIELFNASDDTLNLGEYILSNDVPARFLKFNMPDITLAPGETFVAGIDNTGVFRIRQGEQIFLIRDNIVEDSVSVPIMAETESYGRFGETNDWRYYASPTPGAVN